MHIFFTKSAINLRISKKSSNFADGLVRYL